MQCANKVGAVDQTAAAIRRLNKHDIGREADTLEIEPQLSPDYRGHAGGRRGDAGARQGRKEVRVGVRAGPMLSSPADDPLPCTITRYTRVTQTHNAVFFSRPVV